MRQTFLSIRKGAQLVRICSYTLWKMLRKDLDLVAAYKVQLVKEISTAGHRRHYRFVNWGLKMLQEYHEIHQKIIFSCQKIFDSMSDNLSDKLSDNF